MPLDVEGVEAEAVEGPEEEGEAEHEWEAVVDPVWVAVEHVREEEGADLRCPPVHTPVPQIWAAVAPAEADPTWDNPTSKSQASHGLPVLETIAPPLWAGEIGHPVGFIPGIPRSPIFRIDRRLGLGQLDHDLAPRDDRIPACRIWVDNVQVEIGPTREIDLGLVTDQTWEIDLGLVTDQTWEIALGLVTDPTRGTDQVQEIDRVPETGPA